MFNGGLYSEFCVPGCEQGSVGGCRRFRVLLDLSNKKYFTS